MRYWVPFDDMQAASNFLARTAVGPCSTRCSYFTLTMYGHLVKVWGL